MARVFSYPDKPRHGDAIAVLSPSAPKPFFGYSDNTNLHLFLWNLALVSYLGGSVMVQFGWPVAMHAFGRRSLAAAMFTRDTVLLTPPAYYCDEDGDWTDPATFGIEPASFPASPWSWYGPAIRVTGRPGAATSRSSTSTCGPGGTCCPRRTTRAPSSSWRRRRTCRRPSRCTGC